MDSIKDDTWKPEIDTAVLACAQRLQEAEILSTGDYQKLLSLRDQCQGKTFIIDTITSAVEEKNVADRILNLFEQLDRALDSTGDVHIHRIIEWSEEVLSLQTFTADRSNWRAELMSRLMSVGFVVWSDIIETKKHVIN